LKFYHNGFLHLKYTFKSTLKKTFQTLDNHHYYNSTNQLNQYCISQPHPWECKTLFFSFFIVFSHNLLFNSRVKHLETFPNLNLLWGAFSLGLKGTSTCHIHFETLIKWEQPFQYPRQDFIVWYDDCCTMDVTTKFVKPKFVFGPMLEFIDLYLFLS
jgi:hypothetical protein